MDENIQKWYNPETQTHHFRQKDGRVCTSHDRIHFDHPRLRYADDELLRMTENCSCDVIGFVPGFRYWDLGSIRKMSQPVNICGHQQRAFEFYWTILHGTQRGRVFLGIGSGGVDGPSSFGTDKFCGESSMPEFHGVNGYPHFCMDAEEEFPFFSGKFAGVVAHHVLEHLVDHTHVLREMLRVVEPDGYVCIVMPDLAFSERGSIDPTHVSECSSDEFLSFVHSLDLPCEVVEHNTLDNDFSFNTVLKRKG